MLLSMRVFVGVAGRVNVTVRGAVGMNMIMFMMGVFAIYFDFTNSAAACRTH